MFSWSLVPFQWVEYGRECISVRVVFKHRAISVTHTTQLPKQKLSGVCKTSHGSLGHDAADVRMQHVTKGK